MMRSLENYVQTYKQLHATAELGLREWRTSKIVTSELSAIGVDPIVGIGGTGVAVVVENGPGPTVLVRADMDALPVTEMTDLEYASKEVDNHDELGSVGVSHACGHDLHTACLLAATDSLVSDRDSWSGTLISVFQPGEETGFGARSMIDDGLFDRVPAPNVLLAQHVGPALVGYGAVHDGVVMGASDVIHIVFLGQGGHASQPENAIDPVLMAASFVVRLQAIVSRVVPSSERIVVTVGAMNAGTMASSIPESATVKINVRSFSDALLGKVISCIRTFANAEALAWNAKAPSVEHIYHLPVLMNSREHAAIAKSALQTLWGKDHVFDLPPVSASEDFGLLVAEAKCDSVYWFFGGMGEESFTMPDGSFPTNHSPFFAPVAHQALSSGLDSILAVFHATMSRLDL